MEVAALVIAFASFGAAAASMVVAWASRADALKSADRADKAQRDAAESAAEAIAAYRRTSEALESIAFATGPPWTLRFRAGDTYLLTNESNREALDVEVASDDPSLVTVRPEDLPSRIGPKSAGFFWAGKSLDTTSSTITVRWKTHVGAEMQEWKFPLPARP